MLRSLAKRGTALLALWIISVVMSPHTACQPTSKKVIQLSPSRAVITDSVLDSMLNLYCKEVESKVVAVTIERCDDSYNFTLRSIGTYDEVTRNPSTFYRLWKDRMLLIYNGIENVFSIDSTQKKTFYKKMRPLLPDAHTTKKIREGLYESTTISFHPVTWQFRVVAGKVLWLHKQNTG